MIHKSAADTLKACEDAVAEARAFFGIDPLFDTPVRADRSEGGASINIDPGYMHRPISVDLDYYMRNPDLIRADMAHEVAHLLTDELSSVIQRLPPEYSDRDHPIAMMIVDAVERATVRCEKLFLRERPASAVSRRRTKGGRDDRRR